MSDFDYSQLAEVSTENIRQREQYVKLAQKAVDEQIKYVELLRRDPETEGSVLERERNILKRDIRLRDYARELVRAMRLEESNRLAMAERKRKEAHKAAKRRVDIRSWGKRRRRGNYYTLKSQSLGTRAHGKKI